MKKKSNLVFNINFLGFDLNWALLWSQWEHPDCAFLLWYAENQFVLLLNHNMELNILKHFVWFCFYISKRERAFFFHIFSCVFLGDRGRDGARLRSRIETNKELKNSDLHLLIRNVTLKYKLRLCNSSVLSVPTRLVDYLETGILVWVGLQACRQPLTLNEEQHDVILRRLQRMPLVHPHPDLGEGHPLVGLTRISISVLSLGEEMSRMHFNRKNNWFWKSTTNLDSGIFIWVSKMKR